MGSLMPVLPSVRSITFRFCFSAAGASPNVAMEAILKLRGPSHKGATRPPKIYYVSQVGAGPPTIVCFVNDVRSFPAGYQRFLLRELRRRTPFTEVPIRLIFRPRGGQARKKTRER